MSTSSPQAKRGKRTLDSYFKARQPNQIEDTAARSPPFASSSSARNQEVPVVNLEHEEVRATNTRNVPQVAADNAYTTSLERDPGLRIPIMQHPVGKRDEVRRAYLQMGRNVTRLDPPSRPEYTIQGFRNWHKVKNGDKGAFLAHMGKNGSDSFHSKCVEDAENLMNPSQHVSTHLSSWSKEEVLRNRLRLTTIIGICMWLAFQLCRRLVETKKAEIYPLIDRLIRLILTLPVSTATAERYFSTMTRVKTALRNKMEQKFLRSCMMLYIEKTLAQTISIDSIIDEFISSKDRKVPLILR